MSQQPLIPWEPGNIPDSIQNELNRRKSNRGFEFVAGDKGEWENLDGEWNFYKGPMSPWIRFCSNGAGKSAYVDESGIPYYDKQGFVLFSGKNFYSGYGFDRLGGNKNESIIGYLPNGTPHIIDNDIKTSHYPIHVPPPEIERINVTIQKELYRRARIEWVCFSSKQLEYMTPYFLVPGITCILEWGWNHFDPSSLLDLTDVAKLKDFNNNPYPLYNEHILRSRGNYDVLFGKVTHFEWSIDGNKIRAVTEVTSQDRIYAGLTVDSSISDQPDKKKKEEEAKVHILDSLKSFVKDSLPGVKAVITAGDLKKQTVDQGLAQLPEGIQNFVIYLKKTYPEAKYGTRWQEIIYGVFAGREFTDKNTNFSSLGVVGPYGVTNTSPKTKSKSQSESDNIKNYDNKDKDFDRKDKKSVWINMGMLVEILNYHSYNLKGFKDQPMFKIDINDCVISGHPNLISTDGSVLLLPNAESPKYFFGDYGNGSAEEPSQTKLFGQEVLNAIKNPLKTLGGFKLETREIDTTGTGVWAPAQKTKSIALGYAPIDSTVELPKTKEYEILGNSDSRENMSGLDRETVDALGVLADWRLQKVCQQPHTTAYRDNLDVLINALRYERLGNSKTFEFPFIKPEKPQDIDDTKPYPARYSGYLKNIYFSVEALQNIINDASVKTFPDVLNKVLSMISNACANFWDFKLVNSTGKSGDKKGDTATMKVVDNRFIYSVNSGNVYTFDYYDSESILQGIKFTPTLSNAQAIRTIYAETNNPNRKIVLNDNNELLDYKFKDRLFLDEINKSENSGVKTSSTFIKTMKTLQGLTPVDDSYQITKQYPDGSVHVKRLALPKGEDILKLLLDDGDEENNPRYTGIMPGIQAQFTIQGIGGLRTFMMFLVRNLPEPYSHKNIVFRIIDLTENVEGGKWTTTITAGIIPLRKHIKDRLGITGENS